MQRSCELNIESTDHEARGIGRQEGKVIFVDQAMPGERVVANIRKIKKSHELGSIDKFIERSSDRVTPNCENYGVCGGCSFQHANVSSQLAIKQRVLEDALERIGGVVPEYMLPPVSGPQWGYRKRARLSSRYVRKKGAALVGFRERGKSYVVDMKSCEILPPKVSDVIPHMRALVDSLSIRESIPQIEVACGDNVDVLAFRHLEDLPAPDEEKLINFGNEYGFVIYGQRSGPDSLRCLTVGAEDTDLTYQIKDLGLIYGFKLSEFTQVNTDVNEILVRRAIKLLDIKPSDNVVDLFCGLGNFSLAIAKAGVSVIGLEGSQQLVDRAKENAVKNKLQHLCDFRYADLFVEGSPEFSELTGYNKMLIDPPRDGALAVVTALRDSAVSKIVYVSCNPATLARDAGIMVRDNGYTLKSAGIVNMFPNTSHVESIALFVK
jgi:23S rRNA (uracil1939-C5)-methyltransferase